MPIAFDFLNLRKLLCSVLYQSDVILRPRSAYVRMVPARRRGDRVSDASLLHCTSPKVAPNRPAGMSGLWSLLGAKRTWLSSGGSFPRACACARSWPRFVGFCVGVCGWSSVLYPARPEGRQGADHGLRPAARDPGQRGTSAKRTKLASYPCIIAEDLHSSARGLPLGMLGRRCRCTSLAWPPPSFIKFKGEQPCSKALSSAACLPASCSWNVINARTPPPRREPLA